MHKYEGMCICELLHTWKMIFLSKRLKVVREEAIGFLGLEDSKQKEIASAKALRQDWLWPV